jgi:4,5-dihydroxyphthalate decarboxylase
MNQSKTENRGLLASRREFLRHASLAAGALSVGAANSSGNESEEASGKSQDLSITISGYEYGRVKALADGEVQVKGCEAKFEVDAIGNLNSHIFSGPQTRDVTEIGLHPFMLAYANEGFRDYTLLPIFPLRVFRHKSVFIRTDRGINKPEDLLGKSVATPGYSSTSLTWIRGIFQDEYGIKPQDVKWVSASKDSSAQVTGKVSSLENVLPEGVTIMPGPVGKDESDLLESGEVDALFHAVEPRGYIQGHPKIARLFEDYRSTERAYFAKTGIFPIMHAVAIKNNVLKRNPWLAKAVFDAYSKAKSISYEHMAKLGWAFDSLPWYGQELEETRALMGDNFYSYGIEPNRKALEALFRYSYEQGLSSRKLTVEELFAPESLEFDEF